ncbi:hypothetical protein GGI1_23336 [Acidithiobacillus sp. GGI-221]|nr:hypothetical protein GGI1_23336 [Acidithiobacillus sp. GGI-221]
MTAADQTAKRNARIEALITQGDQWAGKLDDQDDGKKHRGRKLSGSDAKARFYHAVCEAHLSRIIQVDMAASSLATISTIAHGRWRNAWMASSCS